MIKTKADLKEYLKEDNTQHWLKNKSSLFLFIRQEEFYFIRKYLILLRKQEYHINNVYNNKLHLLMYFFYTARKNRLGNKINLNVPENCLGKGVTIYHTDIVINFGSFIGDYSKLHGSNCIGNNGINDKAPQIGSFVDIGYGAILIGNIKIADNITIGANSLVNKTFTKIGSMIAGIPAIYKK